MYGEKLSAESVKAQINTTAYLPVAAFGDHGPHLPLNTDLIITGAYARAISSQIGAFLLPVQPFMSCCEYSNRFSPGVDAGLMYDMVMDLAQELKRQGYRRLVIQERSIGASMLFALTRHLNANEKLQTVLINPAALAAHAGILQCGSDLHAGEVDTSLMLYLEPGLVRTELMVKADCVPVVPQGFIDYKSISVLSESGVWGMPSLANAGKGRQLFEAGVQEAVREIHEVFAFMDENGDYTGGRENSYLENIKKH